MQATDVQLGMTVTFKKYGAVQVGTVTARKTVEVVTTVEHLSSNLVEPERKETSRAQFRVDYTLRNGNEGREWMYAYQFEGATDASTE